MKTRTFACDTRFIVLSLLLLALSLAGCAKKNHQSVDPASADMMTTTTSEKSTTSGVPKLIGQSDTTFDDTSNAEVLDIDGSIKDPFERWNRFWFSFNDTVYTAIQPIADGYAYVVPSFLRTGIKNVYNNILFPMRFLNCLLQLDFTKAQREFGRFLINSTFGFGGLVDVAKTDPNLYPQDEDFGQTLGRWGMGYGFYMVIPFLGPSSARDGFGMIVDLGTSPTTYILEPWYLSYIIKGADRFNMLPELLADYNTMKQGAIEPYVALRDFYVQYRNKKVRE
ncbi:MlaA family lipoprotein [Desulfovibrio inopinatus]|uniref:MlaA family lipoprotein n=1 Tax=Desulfovibrio inopinatus TaxID=102109 RepID=UPI000683E02F|nr:VacJ family lipoprotein [Desulfovibrio inopinatus]